jgi:NAD(P)-dependent dehydrogenase (short-subunit alcohol dehydrogenase family)/rhamnose utilization protein RhaD (predicted bifunctional aldolase and dehydrogenase)
MHTQELLLPEILEKELNALIESAHSLGLDKSLVLPGSSSISAKQETTDLIGRSKKILFISGKDEKLAEINSCGFSSFINQSLIDLLCFDTVSDRSLEFELQACRLPGSNSRPSLNLFLHAVIPYSYVFFTQPISLTAISATKNGKASLEEIFKKTIAVLPYHTSGLPLAKSILQAHDLGRDSGPKGLFILNQGLVTFGDTPQEALQQINRFNEQAVQYIKAHQSLNSSKSTISSTKKVPRQELAALRNSLSIKAEAPLILRTRRDLASRDMLQPDEPTRDAPCLPSHLPAYKYFPLFGREIESYEAVYSSELLENDAMKNYDTSDPAPRIILDPELGFCSAGRTVDEAVANAEYFMHSVLIHQQSERLGSYIPLPYKIFIEEKNVDSLISYQPVETPPFTGEIAIVTGAASGIGKACANSLLERGAAVVGLDISTTIENIFKSRKFLGLVCDVGDEDSVRNAIDQTTLAFGGLDMLVLNAGIFPSGCRIDAMDMDEWEKVMRINLHGNMALMREAFPLLKLAPHHGRVVVNGSRNVKAPGPGASAYSASKAALTQLARVAALEWGKDGIRVNVVHPNAVFDTALYTEEVLKARAASYGITVEQYKKNNILSVEITSRDVGEMVAEMCGPLFAKVTGAQVSIDGGSDRVI